MGSDFWGEARPILHSVVPKTVLTSHSHPTLSLNGSDLAMFLFLASGPWSYPVFVAKSFKLQPQTSEAQAIIRWGQPAEC